jgi:CMP-N,N'-diacetyllegionaminic acid synthase
MNKKILVTICARGGSKGVKGKNIRILNGKPLISYTIKQALLWGKSDAVVVSTDSEEIARVSLEYGAQVPFVRPPELAGDAAPKLPSIRHALLESEKVFKTHYDIIVDLDPTSPVRNSQDLDNCLRLFETHEPDSLFSVIAASKSPYFNMVEEDESGRAFLCKKVQGTVLRRQDAPRVYSLNACIYFYKRDYLVSEKSVGAISSNSRVYVMNDNAGIDIDREVDFLFVEFLVNKGIVSL